jgi:hypothetical protein
VGKREAVGAAAHPITPMMFLNPSSQHHNQRFAA